MRCRRDPGRGLGLQPERLVAVPDPLQFGAPLPEPVHAGLQPSCAMGQIALDESRTGKSAENGRVATGRMAESCANDIDCI
jgi:hypothetical protein